MLPSLSTPLKLCSARANTGGGSRRILQIQGAALAGTPRVPWRDPPACHITAGPLPPSWQHAGLHLPPKQTPLSSSRSSTHLPLLKLLRGVDSLQGPRVDSLRLLDQLREQDWGGQAGTGPLTFQHLKVGWFCWLGPWLSGQAEPRLLPCTSTHTMGSAGFGL